MASPIPAGFARPVEGAPELLGSSPLLLVSRRQLRRTPLQPVREQGTSAQPLAQRQLDLRVLSQRGREADLRGVVSSYSVGGATYARRTPPFLPHPFDGGIPTHQRYPYPCCRRDRVFQDRASEATELLGIRHDGDRDGTVRQPSAHELSHGHDEVRPFLALATARERAALALREDLLATHRGNHVAHTGSRMDPERTSALRVDALIRGGAVPPAGLAAAPSFFPEERPDGEDARRAPVYPDLGGRGGVGERQQPDGEPQGDLCLRHPIFRCVDRTDPRT